MTAINFCSVIQPLGRAKKEIQESINALPLYDDRRKSLYALQDKLTDAINFWLEEENNSQRPVNASGEEWDLDDFS